MKKISPCYVVFCRRDEKSRWEYAWFDTYVNAIEFYNFIPYKQKGFFVKVHDDCLSFDEVYI